MKPLFITATNTDVGKTHISKQIILDLAKQGLKVGAFKPIETGVETTPLDANDLLTNVKLVNENFKDFEPKDITAYTYKLPAAPFCADTNHEISIDKIIEKYNELSKLCDILLVEGAGGLMVPITKDFNMIDLAQKLNANVLLVTPSKLGCINDTLLSIEKLKSTNLNFDWCVNLYQDKDSFDEVTKPFYDVHFKNWWTFDHNGINFIKKLISI